MQTYDIKYNVSKKYPIIIYSTSYFNPIQNLSEISKEINNKIKSKCDILFDLLLSNGEEFNRFAVAKFDGNEIDYNTIETKKISCNKELKVINKYYKENKKILNQGVLTASQKLKFAK